MAPLQLFNIRKFMNNDVAFKDPFRFKQFAIEQDGAFMKIGTDGVLLGAWMNVEGKNRILDIGTGTGIIAIMAAQRNGTAQIDAVEINLDAGTNARFNFESCTWQDRLHLHCLPIQDFENEQTYDLIVCNPPFFTGGTLSSNDSRNNVRHTVKLPNGDLIRCVRRLLSADGEFSVILPYIEGLRFKEMAESSGFHCSKMTEVKGHVDKGVERLLLTFSKSAQICKVNELVINLSDKRHHYTEEYTSLVKEFYTIIKV